MKRWYIARNIEEQESSIINKLRPAAFLRPVPRDIFPSVSETQVPSINVHDVNKSFIASEKRRKSLRSADFISSISFNFDVRTTVGQSRFSRKSTFQQCLFSIRVKVRLDLRYDQIYMFNKEY